MSNIKEVLMVMVLLSYFSRYRAWHTDVYGESRDNQIFLDRWVTKFSKVWGSARAPSAAIVELIIVCSLSHQICPPGTIQFERDGINQGPYRFGERPWLRYTPMLAPYWAPTDLGSFIDGPSKVFYHVYQGPDSSAILQKATDDVLTVFSSDLPQGKTFFASWVLVVTWQDIRHQLENDITRNLVRFDFQYTWT